MDTRSTINQALSLPSLSPALRAQVKEYLQNNVVLTKKEGNKTHVNVFFLPYDKHVGKIYLGHHKKADDWIPPGGHIEEGETPVEAVIREMQEELSTRVVEDQLELFSLSYKHIGRPEAGCVGHYDIWYLVHISASHDFVYDHGEFYDAGWFPIQAGLAQIRKNRDFKNILSPL